MDILSAPRARLFPYWCEGSAEGFFMGWHPYLIPEHARSLDGLGSQEAVWLAKFHLLSRLISMIEKEGLTPPQTSYAFAKWLSENYPEGLVFEFSGYQQPQKVIITSLSDDGIKPGQAEQGGSPSKAPTKAETTPETAQGGTV